MRTLWAWLWVGFPGLNGSWVCFIFLGGPCEDKISVSSSERRLMTSSVSPALACAGREFDDWLAGGSRLADELAEQSHHRQPAYPGSRNVGRLTCRIGPSVRRSLQQASQPGGRGQAGRVDRRSGVGELARARLGRRRLCETEGASPAVLLCLTVGIARGYREMSARVGWGVDGSGR